MVKILGLAAVAALAALVLGFGGHFGASTQTAHADTTDVAVVGCEFIANAIDGSITNNLGFPIQADADKACGVDPLLPADITNLAKAIGDKDGVLTKSDFSSDEVDESWDDNQLSTDCTAVPTVLLTQFNVGLACTLDVFVFVDDEKAVSIDLPSGLKTVGSGTLDFTCSREGLAVGTGSGAISAISLAAVPVITTTAAHGLMVGDSVTLAGTDSVPTINGTFPVASVPTTTTFTVTGAAAVTTAGTTGTFALPAGTTSFTTDNDCSDAVADNGDGVVVFQVLRDTASSGDVKTVKVTQESVDQTFDVNVVGPSIQVQLTLVETTIGTNGSTTNVKACQKETPVSDAINPPTSTLAYAVVTDQDDTVLTRAPVVFSFPTGDSSIAALGVGEPGEDVVGNTLITIDPLTEGAPTAAYVVVCGGKSTGTTTLKAEINLAPSGKLSSTDNDTQDLTVLGAPSAIALTATPATIKCDGTEKATVSAKVTDSAGANVADGTPVNFSVVALGTADPINTTTKDGVASTTVTPLSNSSAGVTVVVTAGDSLIATVVQTSIRVDCALPLATQPTVGPVVTPPSGISGPDTGTGGYLGQDGSDGFPAWTLVMLALGSMTLVAGGLVARRAGK